MLQNRIQKLLCTEYSDFNDLIVIESPFAQTTRDGTGVRQLQIGISPNRLILACDNPCQNTEPWNCGDPETESLELLSIVPLESVTLTVFRRRTRNTIKAHFSNGRILFFELAVSSRREMFWNLWCDRMRLLAPELISPTLSETSVGSSSSTITNYSRQHQLDKAWHERDLFLGSKFGTWPVKKKRQPVGSPHVPRKAEAVPNKSGNLKVCQVNRFGAGINENCSTSLFLPAAQVIVAQSFLEDVNGFFKEEREEEGKWPEMFMDKKKERTRQVQHPRRYGLQTMPHLLAGLGLWALPNPQANLAQMRRWSSEVSLSTREASISTAIPKSLLKSSVSSESLLRYSKQYEPAIIFWTPGFWYKPRNVSEAYIEQKHHLSEIRLSNSQSSTKKKRWLKVFKKKRTHNVEWKDGLAMKKNQDFRSLLVADIALSSWDFDSTLIAYQITLFDKDLFIRIPISDFEALLKERNSRNSPNFRALVAFSNRLANLITTEIIRIDSVKMRARLVARWINVADKLFKLQNLQGVASVLAGLQSAGVYRLTGTWSYLRHHHNSKYRRMTTLMRLNRDSRSERYQSMMVQVVKTTPYILTAEYLISVLLGWSPPPISPPPTEWKIESLLTGWVSAAMEYGLTDTPLVREFLTKARYLEELDNFILASQLEPTIHTPSYQ